MRGGQTFRLEPLGFERLRGWTEDDHLAALHAFRSGAEILSAHPPKQRALGVDAALIADTLRAAAGFSGDAADARRFFEDRFAPFAIVQDGREPGFFTGYFEPIVAGSRIRSPRFPVPLHAVPDDLVEVDPDAPPVGSEAGLRFARFDGIRHTPYPDRGAIMAGLLDGRGCELAFLADPIDAFFVHVQGAARIRLAEGGELRVTYAAKNGHPYAAIGRVLLDRGELAPGRATMASIRAWLADHRDAADEVLAQNRSYIFFREAAVDDPLRGPIAAAKVPLMAGRSLAVDRLIHTFHTPVWVETTLPPVPPVGPDRLFRRLLVAHDTGSAIIGPTRGDIFFGSGDTAGSIAGAMQATGNFVVLLPRGGNDPR